MLESTKCKQAFGKSRPQFSSVYQHIENMTALAQQTVHIWLTEILLFFGGAHEKRYQGKVMQGARLSQAFKRIR